MKDRGTRGLGHVSALDGLRGIAILGVIGMHLFNVPSGGFYGVDLFFVLSGFLITTLLLEERDEAGGVSLPGFYRRRAYRLLPALCTVLAAWVIVTRASLRGLEQTAAGGFYVANILSAFGSHLLGATPLIVFWSLAQEEQFYLLWPLVLILLLKRGVPESRIAKGLVGLVIALALYRSMVALNGATEVRIYCGPDTHADGLVLGCALALMRRRGLRVPQFAGLVGLVGLLAGYALVSPTVGCAYSLLPMSVAATLLVGAAIEASILSRCLAFRPLAWVGMISYSLYVWHLFVAWLLSWQEPVVLPASFLVATFSYYKIEKPLRTALRSRRAPAIQPAPGDFGEDAGQRALGVTSVFEPNDAALYANG